MFNNDWKALGGMHGSPNLWEFWEKHHDASLGIYVLNQHMAMYRM